MHTGRKISIIVAENAWNCNIFYTIFRWFPKIRHSIQFCGEKSVFLSKNMESRPEWRGIERFFSCERGFSREEIGQKKKQKVLTNSTFCCIIQIERLPMSVASSVSLRDNCPYTLREWAGGYFFFVWLWWSLSLKMLTIRAISWMITPQNSRKTSQVMYTTHHLPQWTLRKAKEMCLSQCQDWESNRHRLAALSSSR